MPHGSLGYYGNGHDEFCTDFVEERDGLALDLLERYYYSARLQLICCVGFAVLLIGGAVAAGFTMTALKDGKNGEEGNLPVLTAAGSQHDGATSEQGRSRECRLRARGVAAVAAIDENQPKESAAATTDRHCGSVVAAALVSVSVVGSVAVGSVWACGCSSSCCSCPDDVAERGASDVNVDANETELTDEGENSSSAERDETGLPHGTDGSVDVDHNPGESVTSSADAAVTAESPTASWPSWKVQLKKVGTLAVVALAMCGVWKCRGRLPARCRRSFLRKQTASEKAEERAEKAHEEWARKKEFFLRAVAQNEKADKLADASAQKVLLTAIIPCHGRVT
jgi:hypothetical protein